MAERKNEASWIESRRRWQINVQHDGQRKTFTSSIPGRKGKIAAEKKADQWLANGSTLHIGRFPECYQSYLEKVQIETSTSNYRKLEQIGRLYLLPQLKNKKIHAITEQDWQDCIDNAYLNHHLSKKSLLHIRGAITSFCRYLRKNDRSIQLPEFLSIPKKATVGKRNILQPQDLQTLFTVDTVTIHKQPEPAFFIHAWRFIVLTGLRRGELCGLRQEDIVNQTIQVRRSITEYNEITSGKNDNAQRIVPLSHYAQIVLAAQKQMLKDQGIISPWLFPDENGDILQPKHLYNKWRTYRRQHDIHGSLHELRHTFISIAKADVPEQLLKQVVGHSISMDTFGVYGHQIDGDTQRVANLLDHIFDQFLPQ